MIPTKTPGLVVGVTMINCRHYMRMMAIVDTQTMQDRRQYPSKQPRTIKRSVVSRPLKLVAQRTIGKVAVPICVVA